MRREARVHPRKYAAVSLAEGCVAEATSAPLKKTHDTRSAWIAVAHLRRVHPPPPRLPFPPITRRTPRSEREGESEGGACAPA